MNNKLVLTSLLAIAVAMPAMATDFPDPAGNGVVEMKVNQVYTGAATEENMGVSANNSTATAAAYYEILPGYYLPANSYTAAECTAGNYCPGVTPAVTKTASAQGLNQCPSGYNNSNSGTSSKVDCYTSTCPTSNHAATGTSYNGSVYYGGLNNCEPSACEAGYTKLNINAATTFGNFNPIQYLPGVNSEGPNHTGYWASKNADDDYIYGGWTCSNTFYDGESIPSDDLSAGGTSGQYCYCWINGVSTEVDGYQRFVEMKSLAVPVNSGVNACNQCENFCANAFATGDSAVQSYVTGADYKDLLLKHASNTEKCIPSMYTITYSCGTGADISGTTPASQDVTYAADYTPATNTCARTGYRPTGWEVSGTGNPGDAVTAGTATTWNYTENKTFTSLWNENTYTVVYNNNVAVGTGSVSGTMENSSYRYTESKALTANGYTYCKKTFQNQPCAPQQFLGWATTSGGEKVYDNGQTVSKLTATHNGTVNLYAKWGNCTACNPGVGATCTLTAPNGVCRYTTACQDGYGNLQGNGTPTPSCSGGQITLNFANGGHGTAPAQSSCTYGSTFSMPAAITTTGYTFNKWNVNNGTFNAGQTSVACDSATLGVTSGAVTITASWTANKINIVWNGIENASVQTADNNDMTNFNSTDHTAQSQVNYDGNIATPKAAMAPAGQTFVGWKFVK